VKSILKFSFLYVSITLPYLVYNLNKFELGFSILLFSVSLLVFSFYIDNLKYNKRWIFIPFVMILFFHFERIYSDLYYLFYDWNIRFRYFLIIISVLTYLLLFCIEEKKITIFFLFFTLTTIMLNENYLYRGILNKVEVKNENLFFNVLSKESPTILIILDEYASDKSLKISDSSFKDSIESLGFLYYDDIKTNEIYTDRSVPSILNFNLSNSNIITFKQEQEREKGWPTPFESFILEKLFLNNSLKDSLVQKEIKIESYGLCNFSTDNLTYLNHYLWEKNRVFNFEEIIKSTILHLLYTKRVFNPTDEIDGFRSDVFEKLEKLNPQKNTFYYFHLYLPHEPYRFNEQFQYNTEISKTENYISFRKFLQKKLIRVLDNKKFVSSRIIITGDHGYRDNIDIDKYSTSVFIKGYDKKNIPSLFTVQDLGYLIYNSFK
jgi:hypothetical protein